MRRPVPLAALLLLAVVTVAGAAPPPGRQLSLSTLEGEVVSIQLLPGEGDLEVVAVDLRPDGDGDKLIVLLAPESACEEIGFQVTEGDRLRVRIFEPQDGIAKAHKVLNLSQSTMVRFRTLRKIPLWTTTGAWQGGPSQTQPGGALAPQHRHGSRSTKPGGGPPTRGGPGS